MLMISVDEVMDMLEEYAVCTPDEEKSLIQRINQASMFIDNIGTVSKWISVKDRLPETSMKNILFVIYTPAWHDLTDDFPEDERDFPEEIETVSGWIDVFDNGKKRYWNWIGDGDYQATIENEYSEEMTGCITYITHWMPLPEPPKESNSE